MVPMVCARQNNPFRPARQSSRTPAGAPGCAAIPREHSRIFILAVREGEGNPMRRLAAARGAEDILIRRSRSHANSRSQRLPGRARAVFHCDMLPIRHLCVPQRHGRESCARFFSLACAWAFVLLYPLPKFAAAGRGRIPQISRRHKKTETPQRSRDCREGEHRPWAPKSRR
jgi:hypothetical protein